jgi:flagellar M-ring protein FliF
LDGLKNFLAQIGAKRLAALGVVAAVLLGSLTLLSGQMTRGSMGLLYTDLEPTAAKAITDRLTALNVPFELSPDGTAVMAPQRELARLRMELAGEQLGGAVGYELLDQQNALGSSSFLQNVNHVRAIEGELARSIQSLESVQSARVHLVMPQRELFQRESRKPSASITLRTRGQLTSQQVNAIRHLVAAGVPDLQPGQISIVDQNGTLLARSDASGDGGISGSMEERTVAIEERMRQQLETMIERVVGPGKARVEVSAQLTTEQVRQDAAVYDPDRQVVARTTTNQRNDRNQDSQEGGEVGVANNLPEEQADTAAGPTSQSTSDAVAEETVFQNSLTRTTTVREPGSISRLSVAVLVDGTYAGEAPNQTYTPRTPQEIEQITRLVRGAVGFDEERGDTVDVVNLRFAAPDVVAEEDAGGLPLGLEGSDIAQIIQTSVIGLLGLAALFFLVRPMLKPAKPADAALAGDATAALPAPDQRLALAPPDQGDETMALIERAAAGDEGALAQVIERRQMGTLRLPVEAEIDVAQIEGRLKAGALKKVGELVQRHPGEATAVIRQWMAA